MKKRILTLMCALTVSMLVAMTFAQERLLPNLKKMDNLESVYVGKTLLRMIANENVEGLNLADGMFDAADFIKYIDSIEVISAESKKATNYLRPLAEEAISKLNDMELAMQTEDNNEYVRIYVQPTADGNSFSRIVVVNSEEGEYNIIDMRGTFPYDILSSFTEN